VIAETRPAISRKIVLDCSIALGIVVAYCFAIRNLGPTGAYGGLVAWTCAVALTAIARARAKHQFGWTELVVLITFVMTIFAVTGLASSGVVAVAAVPVGGAIGLALAGLLFAYERSPVYLAYVLERKRYLAGSYKG